jgi:ABC-2 type transport system permease protein
MRSLLVIKTLAANTVLELLRQKALTILIILGIILAGGANFFSQFSFDIDQDFKFIKDFAVGILTLVGVLVAIISVAQMLPAELESRTVLTILTKPVQRWEFLLGKFAGICVLLAALTLAIGLILSAVLYVQEAKRVGEILESHELALSEGHQIDPEQKKPRH